MQKWVFLVIAGILVSFTLANAEDHKGYLDEKGDADHFTINAANDTLDVTFTYPEDAKFWVLVIGQAGTNLGYYDLSEGEVVELTGGGYFTFVIISHKGDGKWTASYELE